MNRIFYNLDKLIDAKNIIILDDISNYIERDNIIDNSKFSIDTNVNNISIDKLIVYGSVNIKPDSNLTINNLYIHLAILKVINNKLYYKSLKKSPLSIDGSYSFNIDLSLLDNITIILTDK